MINSKTALETSKINLCQLMNIPYDENMQLEKINPESVALNMSPNPMRFTRQH
jgi:hypothetical protein